MGDNGISQNHPSKPDQVLLSLAKELKEPLTFIARQAEFSKNSLQNESADVIERTAQEALGLIDSYLLSAKTQFGQLELRLEPVGLGALLTDVAHRLDSQAKRNSYTLEFAMDYHKPVMVDRRAFTTSLVCLAQILLTPHNDKKNRVIKLSAFKRSGQKAMAGVLSSNTAGFSDKSIHEAIVNQGVVNQALKGSASLSGIQLVMANSLASAMQSSVSAIKYRNLKGLGIEVIKSEQMALI